MTRARKRLFFLVFSLFCFFSLLLVHYYKIQVVEGEYWSKQARRQHFFEVSEPFMRGTFYSNTQIRKAHPEIPQRFVFDIQKFHLFIDPEAIPAAKRDEIVENLTRLLHLSRETSEEVRAQFEVKSRNRRLLMWLNKQQQDEVLNWWYPYCHKGKIAKNALYFIHDFQRSYPFGKLLGQVLHTVQAMRDETTKQSVPTGGLELSLDTYLQGKLGKRVMMRSPRNAFETGEVVNLPENGADIYLTINHCLQAIAEEELERGVRKAKAKAGWAVMMDPKTGEILALAQYPFFYPDHYQDYFNDPDNLIHTRMRAVTDAIEPGSVMKPLTMALALQANKDLTELGEPPLFDPEEKMATLNIPFPGRKRKMIRDTRPHKFLNMKMAMQKSSNVYPAILIDRVLNRFGPDYYRTFLIDVFGFGKKTNIELPAESPGVVPKPGRRYPNGVLEWSKSTPYSMAFGHNFMANSVQVVRAHAVLANGGFLVQPTLIRKVVQNDQVVIDNTKERNFPCVLSEEIVDQVVTAMKFVTKPNGSASRGEVYGYTEAGKSGTGNKVIDGKYSETKYCPAFIGFTPVKDPLFVLLVTLDEPEYDSIRKRHHGGMCCSPIFREIAKRSLEYLGVEPDDPYGYSPNDPRYDREKADWKKEITQLQEIYEKWNN